MKKKLMISLVFVVTILLFAGCTKKEEEPKMIDGGWDTKITEKQAVIDEEIKKAFEDSNDKKYTLVALLGKQVVAGSNYMFLVHDSSSYRVIVVYRDLEGKSSVTYDNPFDFTKYTSESSTNSVKTLVGGWEVSVPDKGVTL